MKFKEGFNMAKWLKRLLFRIRPGKMLFRKQSDNMVTARSHLYDDNRWTTRGLSRSVWYTGWLKSMLSCCSCKTLCGDTWCQAWRWLPSVMLNHVVRQKLIDVAEMLTASTDVAQFLRLPVQHKTAILRRSLLFGYLCHNFQKDWIDENYKFLAWTAKFSLPYIYQMHIEVTCRRRDLSKHGRD